MISEVFLSSSEEEQEERAASPRLATVYRSEAINPCKAVEESEKLHLRIQQSLMKSGWEGSRGGSSGARAQSLPDFEGPFRRRPVPERDTLLEGVSEGDAVALTAIIKTSEYRHHPITLPVPLNSHQISQGTV